MSELHDRVRDKVRRIFAEMAGDRSENLESLQFQFQLIARIAGSIGNETPEAARKEIGFHVSDWLNDAGFLVALALHPERFTDEEIEKGISLLLVHVPGHAAAAAEAFGYPVCGIFKESEPNEQLEPEPNSLRDSTADGRHD